VIIELIIGSVTGQTAFGELDLLEWSVMIISCIVSRCAQVQCFQGFEIPTIAKASSPAIRHFSSRSKSSKSWNGLCANGYSHENELARYLRAAPSIDRISLTFVPFQMIPGHSLLHDLAITLKTSDRPYSSILAGKSSVRALVIA
jgi:hypothetical protein